MTNRSANIAFSALIILGCAVFIQIALGFENPSALAGSQVPTQVFPIAMLSFTAVCSAINIVNYLRGDPEGDADHSVDLGPRVLTRVGLIVALLVLVWLLWDVVGFIPVSIGLGLGIAAVLQVRNIWIFIGLAAYGPLVWAVFRYGIGIEL